MVVKWETNNPKYNIRRVVEMPQLTGLGHVGIYTDDLMKQRDFYTRVIGLEESTTQWASEIGS